VPAAIEAHDLTRQFGAELAVEGLDLEVEAGEVVGLLGPNGAGKTTTVRMLNGVLRPHRGSALVLGLDPAVDGEAVRSRTGVLTETPGLDERLTARENLVMYARIRGVDSRRAEHRAAELLEHFSMTSRADHPVQGFSTGQRKRVALGRALLAEPDVLFLDEPTSGLDPQASRDVLEHIATLAHEHGRTVVLCTHFLSEAGRLCGRVAVLQRGRLQAFGRPQEIAAGLWEGLPVDLDLGSPADERLLATLRSTRGVLGADASSDGARVRVEERADLPELVAALVGREVPVYAAVPRPPTLEDVYFALQERALPEEGWP